VENFFAFVLCNRLSIKVLILILPLSSSDSFVIANDRRAIGQKAERMIMVSGPTVGLKHFAFELKPAFVHADGQKADAESKRQCHQKCQRQRTKD
jgi:hypothetical protein